MSSGFITETEAAEVRKKRQEEWEKVRKPEDPLERPEEVHDHRSLYERLQEQKQKKELEYEEAHKLKNMIKGLDDDEIEFLDLVDRTKLAADRKKNFEEELELNDYRNRVASLQEKTLDKKLQAEVQSVKPKLASNSRKSQTKLLEGVVVKRTEAVKRKHDEVDGPEKESEKCPQDQGSPKDAERPSRKRVHEAEPEVNQLRCIGILPGLGCYNDSSSEMSSDSDQDDSCLSNTDCDFFGRKIPVKEKKQAQPGN